MTIAIGSGFISPLWLVLGATLVGLLVGVRLVFRYGRTTVVQGRSRSARAARVSSIVLVSGALGWSGGMLLSKALGEAAPTLPQAVYMTPEGKPLLISGSASSEGMQDVQQTSQAFGTAPASKPVTVVNLWASWCGPCRREMPAFTHAQALYPDVRFIFANQGETAATVTGFLKQENLRLNNVVLDPDRSWMTRFHSTGIPTTLFFDANGRLLSSRVGELSEAALDAQITQLQQTR